MSRDPLISGPFLPRQNHNFFQAQSFFGLWKKTISSTFYCNRSDFKMQRIPLVGLNLAFLREAHSRGKSKWKSFKNFVTATLLLKLFTGFRNEKKSENSIDKFNKRSKDFSSLFTLEINKQEFVCTSGKIWWNVSTWFCAVLNITKGLRSFRGRLSSAVVKAF